VSLAPLESEHEKLAGSKVKISEADFTGQRDGALLSEREIQCLQLIAAGKTSWAIAEVLGISQHTVNAHIRNIVRKLGVATRPQAVAEAMRRGLIS
jgi:LuxR family quorum sensing-dependent transcriptional regulator